MSLQHGKRADIPGDAIILSREEALQYQTKLIHGWKNSYDTFFFRYGTGILGGLSALTGMYLNNYYRNKFKLFNYGKLSSYLPIVFIPTVTCMAVHSQIVLPDVVLQDKCAVCTEMKSAFFQVSLGSIVPMLLAPLSAIPLALQYNTYDVPYITKEPKKVYLLLRKITKPISNTLFCIFLAHAVAAVIITYLERRSVENVQTGYMKLEKELIDKFG